MTHTPTPPLPEADPPAYRELQLKKMESMVSMATGIAHDMNNYLAAILGNNSVIQRLGTLDTRTRECSKRIESAANLALELADQLALYSGRANAEPQEVDLHDLSENVRAVTASVMPRGVTLTFETHPHCPALHADPVQMLRLLANLVTNAAEAMVDLRGNIRVSFAPYEPAADDADQAFLPFPSHGAWLQVTVTDTGRGISPKIRERIFDPFFSTKIRGRGMGLPEVLGILRLHNGNIIIQSQVGSGTTVRALLPVPPDADLYAEE